MVDYNQPIERKKERRQNLMPSIVYQSADESQMDGIFKGEVNLSIEKSMRSDYSEIFAYGVAGI